MDRQERSILRKQLLEAKKDGDLDSLNNEFKRLIHDHQIEWYGFCEKKMSRDLVTFILSTVSDIPNSSSIFYDWANQVKQISSVPENACSCILSTCANYGNKEEAMEWVHRLQQEGIPLRYICFLSITSRNRHVVPLLQLAQKTNDSDLIDFINQLVSSSPLDLNQKARKESILYCWYGILN